MTREEYDEQRNPLAAALAEFDALYPTPPPGPFDATIGTINTTNPEAPTIDLTWSASDAAIGYMAHLYDLSENHIHQQELGDVLSATDLFSGQMEANQAYSIIMVAYGPTDERHWDAEHWHFNT